MWYKVGYAREIAVEKIWLFESQPMCSVSHSKDGLLGRLSYPQKPEHEKILQSL
jgi:hypothetical protein